MGDTSVSWLEFTVHCAVGDYTAAIGVSAITTCAVGPASISVGPVRYPLAVALFPVVGRLLIRVAIIRVSLSVPLCTMPLLRAVWNAPLPLCLVLPGCEASQCSPTGSMDIPDAQFSDVLVPGN